MDAVFVMEEKVFNYRVAGVWIEHDHVLLHRRKDDTYWALPGGRVKLLEDSKTSLIREMKEELGQDVNVENLLWITENFFDYDECKFHEIGFYFRISGRESSSFQEKEFHGPEGERLIYKWVPLSELERMDVQPIFLAAGLQKTPDHPEHIIVRN